MKAIVCFLMALVVFVSAQGDQTLDNRVLLDRNILSVSGSWNMLVPSNRTTLTVTLFGFGNTAVDAQRMLQEQITAIQESLADYELINFQTGGIMYYPYYDNTAAPGPSASMGVQKENATRNLTGFVATTTFSFSLASEDAAAAIDALITHGNAYISLSTRPDQLSIDEAQRMAVSRAMDDALFKAQAALDRMGRCTANITLVSIDSPISLLPSVSIISNNFGVSSNNNFGLNLNIPMPRDGDMLEFNNPDNMGAGRSMVSAFVQLHLMHASCDEEGVIRDLTANLTVPSIPGDAVLSPIESPVEEASPLESPVEEASPIASPASPLSPAESPEEEAPSRRRRAW